MNDFSYQERESNASQLKQLRDELYEKDQQKSESIRNMCKNHNDERNILENEIQNLQSEKTKNQRQVHEAKVDFEEMKIKLNKMQDDNIHLRNKLQNAQDKNEQLKESLDVKNGEFTKLADKLLRIEEESLIHQRRSKKWEDSLHEVRKLVDRRIECMEEIVGVTSQRSRDDGNVQNWINNVQKRMYSIQQGLEIKIKSYKEQATDAKFQSTQSKKLYKSLENENRKLMIEITDQNKVLDELNKERTSLLLENKEVRFVVQDLEEKVINLTQDLHVHEDTIHQLSNVSSTINFSPSKYQNKKFSSTLIEESRKERERISERYKRYRDTMDSIKNDLDKSPCKFQLNSSIKSPDKKVNLSPIRKLSPDKKVTMSNESPIIHNFRSSQPTSSSPKINNK